MVKKNKMRDSNFEVLRIIAMLMIIAHHIFFHVIKYQLSDKYIYGAFEMFNNPVFYKRLSILEIASISGKIANALFILISGYYMVGKNKIDVKKIIKKLLSQVLFASIVLLLVSVIFSFIYPNSVIEYPNITIFNNEWWFIGYYLIIVLIGSFILNKYLNKLTRKKI